MIFQKRGILAMQKYRLLMKKKKEGQAMIYDQKLSHGKPHPNWFDHWKEVSNAFLYWPRKKAYFFFSTRKDATGTILIKEYTYQEFDPSKPYDQDFGMYNQVSYVEQVPIK